MEWNGGLRRDVFWNNLVIHARKGYVVLLGNHSFSCGKWDKSGIPCQLAIPAITIEETDSLDYVAEWFRKETYSKAYQFLVNPISGK